MKYRKLFTKKVDLVNNLLNLNKKSITPTDVYAEGQKLGINRQTAIRAWNNFVQSGGNVDLRLKSQNGVAKNTAQFAVRKPKATIKNNSITTKAAGTIVKAWMNETDKNIDDFCVENNISVKQFYEWLHEMNVSGKLLDRTIFDFRKYAKLDVKNAIWLAKYPNTKRKSIKSLNYMQLKAYERLIQVLEEYL